MDVRRYGCCFFLCFAFATCGEKGEEVGVIQTSMGTLVVAFYNDVPGHVANFKKLAREGFYDGTTFHRVIPGFMIQGGDPNTKDDDRFNDGTGDPGYNLEPEIRHQHIRGALAGARMPDQVNPNRESSGSQFFICVDPQPHLDNAFTVFGYVVDGLNVAKKISLARRDKKDNPLRKIVVEKVTIQRRELEFEAL